MRALSTLSRFAGWLGFSAGGMPMLTLMLALRPQAQAAPVQFEREIAPILRSYCAGCHNDADHEGDFSVETFARLRQGGDKGDPVVPGQPDRSFLIRSLERTAKPHMPPKDEPQVPAQELALLKRWIAEGAPGPQRDTSLLAHLVVPETAALPGTARPVTALAFTPNGSRLAVARSGRVEFRSTPQGRNRSALDALPGKLNAAHFSPDGRQLLVASGVAGLRGVAQLWDVKAGTLIREFGGHTDLLHDAEFSPKGDLVATAGYDRSLRIWEAATGRLLRTLNVHNGAIFDLAFDPTGTVLASASADQTVKLWRVSDGVRLDTLNQAQGELNAVTFTPDGAQVLAVGQDRRIHQWKFVSREAPALNPVVASRFAHEAAVTALAVSADGQHLLTAAVDRTVKLWSLPELVELRAWTDQPDVAVTLVHDARRQQFVAGRMDGSVGTYPAPPRKPLAAARPVRPVASGATGVLGVALPASTDPAATPEQEPNDLPAQAQVIAWPAQVRGAMDRPGDADLFRFKARAGETVTLAINAAQSGSSLDSRVEVLTTTGQPVEQVVLQAVRDSWFTFRGKDSDTSDDFRLHNWAEMELDEYLYAQGEVVRLWLYPRGPDSGFKVYPGEGRRQTAFGTTALSHALNEPAYVVKPLPAGTRPVPNGLPVFRLPFENDDDPSRQSGADSHLRFIAPTNGEYLVRVTDVRGFGGGTNHTYTLTVRAPRPDFTVKLENPDPQVSPGSARELRFVATRREGFDGPIRVDLAGLPAGFTTSLPVEIEAGQIRATATLSAAPGTTSPSPETAAAVRLTATAEIAGREVAHPMGSLGKLQVGKPPRVTVEILPGVDRSMVTETPGQPLEFRIRPGQTLRAQVRAVRHDFADRIEFGGEDSGRNLPHGVYVDNIGLNGLLIVEGQTEREFVITAAAKAPPGVRRFHLRTSADGGQCSPWAVIRVLPRETAAHP
jgi:WD40 repeat protein